MQKLFRTLFILGDYLTAALSWGMFYYYRKTEIEGEQFELNSTFFYGIFGIPVLWILFYAIQGS